MKKQRLTKEQKAVVESYLGSVFENTTGQRRVEEATRQAYEDAKRLVYWLSLSSATL